MFSKILDYKFQFLTALTLFTGIAAAGIYHYKKSKPQQKKHPKKNNLQSLTLNTLQTLNTSKCHSDHHNQQQKWSSLYSQFYFDKNLQIRKVLDQLQLQDNSVQTIYKYSPLIAVHEYKQFTKEIRKRRRLIRTVNQDQYVRLIMDYQQEVDQLLQRSREEIVYQCEIDPDEFLGMKIVYEATEDLTALVRDARKQLREISFATKRPIPKCKLQKIINQQVSFIRSKLYQRLQNKLQNQLNQSQDQILKVIQAMIDDIIYEKFGYEREEIEFAMTSQWQVQLAKEVKELKRARAQLQSDIGNITLLSQQSDNEEDVEKNPSQVTKSGANSSFLEDDVEGNFTQVQSSQE